MDRDKLNSILKEHSIWLNSAGTRGTRANLFGANLTNTNLTCADLTGANLTNAYLTRANLTCADLTRANLTGADLTGSDLTDANLTGAILPYPVHQAYFGQYNVHTNGEYIRIGCKYLTIQEWLEVDIDRAVQMGLDKKYYRMYRNFIETYAEEWESCISISK